MNPIWRLQHDIRRTRSDNEKKVRKQREFHRHCEQKDQRREDAIDRERQRNIAGQDSSNDVITEEPEKESAAEEFQRELCWCIQQLEQGLTSSKPTSKQAKDADKSLRTLKSHKAPMVKKRQVMRMTFGDYRKKMLAEKTQHEKKTLQPTLTPVASDRQSLSKFYRRAYKCPVNADQEEMEVQHDVNEKKDGEKIVPLQKTLNTETTNNDSVQPFMFNFDIDKNTLDSCQTSPNEEQMNSGKRKNKGKKKKRIKTPDKVIEEKDEDTSVGIMNKEDQKEIKELDQTEVLMKDNIEETTKEPIEGNEDIEK